MPDNHGSWIDWAFKFLVGILSAVAMILGKKVLDHGESIKSVEQLTSSWDGKKVAQNTERISILEQIVRNWDSRHAEICARLSNVEAKLDRLIESFLVRRNDQR